MLRMPSLPVIRRKGRGKIQEYPYHDPGDLATEYAYGGLMDRIREDILHQGSYPLAGRIRKARDLAWVMLPGRKRRWRRAVLAAAITLLGVGKDR